MIHPNVSARVKEGGDACRVWISSRDVAGLRKIAVNAGKSKVPDIVSATVFSRIDVFDLQRCQRRVVLMQLAILAAVSGSFPDQPSCLRVDHDRELLRSLRAFA